MTVHSDSSARLYTSPSRFAGESTAPENRLACFESLSDFIPDEDWSLIPCVSRLAAWYTALPMNLRLIEKPQQTNDGNWLCFESCCTELWGQQSLTKRHALIYKHREREEMDAEANLETTGGHLDEMKAGQWYGDILWASATGYFVAAAACRYFSRIRTSSSWKLLIQWTRNWHAKRRRLELGRSEKGNVHLAVKLNLTKKRWLLHH